MSSDRKLKECISVQRILWWLIFFGSAVNYMLRSNLNIAIVSMVEKRQPKLNNESQVEKCYSENYSNSTNATDSEEILSQDDETRYNWDEKQQGLILGGFFWLFWATQVPGGILAQRYGPKMVYGLTTSFLMVFCLLIPLASSLDYRVVVFLRVLQGFSAGASMPSIHRLTANWIPPNERSKFVTAYMGTSVGAAVTYPFCGLLISWFGWPSVFYITGAIGVIWFTAWWLLAYDSPAQHPRISKEEKLNIMNKIGDVIAPKTLSTPWKKILLSRPVWINIFAEWGYLWGFYTIMTQAPTYFKLIHGWDIQMTGFLSGIPHLARLIISVLMSIFADYLLNNDSMSRTNVRKMATAACCIGQGLFMLALAFSDCNSTAAIVFSIGATGMSGTVSSGALASFIDMSPNFAGIILGISNMIGGVSGFLSAYLVGILTYQNQTVGQWKLVFIISTISLLVPGILHLFFSSSKLQDWNTPTEQIICHELQKLNPEPNRDRAFPQETKHEIKETSTPQNK
ncbi:sialin-like isoform X2 [Periplaneta americana]|uniref:sialin-like isoform X2 n=2 Tax=Periplaneta americana TaxID=6978 RepID=UPI0037E72E05